MSHVQSRLPVLLSISFVLSISVLAVLRLKDLPGRMSLPLAVLVLLYLLWLAIEARVAVRELSHEATRMDRGTLELYASGRAFTVLSALALPSLWDRPGAWLPVGFSLFVFGVAFRLHAIRVLGQFYSHRVRVSSTHRIVSSGPYRILRHPAYTGMIIAHCGFVLCFFNYVSAAILLLYFVPAVILRIRVEEQALFSLQGYEDYAKRRRRLVPLIW